MTTILSTRVSIPKLGPTDIEIEVDYEYNQRHQELTIEGASTRVGKGEVPVWHLLTQRQKRIIEEDCIRDYHDRMAQAREDNGRLRRGE